MKKIAVIAAMDKEAELLRELASDQIIISTSGIGKVAAAVKTAEIIMRYRPDLIINSGIAGGLDKKLEIGDLVAGSIVAYHDVWCGEPNALGQVQGFPLFYQADQKALQCVGKMAQTGLILSGDQFISSAEKLYGLKKKFPDALAIDMESAAIAQTCHIYQTPFISLRLISDTPGVKHHQAQYDAFWKTAADKSFINVRQLLREIVNSTSDAN